MTVSYINNPEYLVINSGINLDALPYFCWPIEESEKEV